MARDLNQSAVFQLLVYQIFKRFDRSLATILSVNTPFGGFPNVRLERIHARTLALAPVLLGRARASCPVPHCQAPVGGTPLKISTSIRPRLTVGRSMGTTCSRGLQVQEKPISSSSARPSPPRPDYRMSG